MQEREAESQAEGLDSSPPEDFAFTVRLMKATDANYIANSWLRGIQRNTYWAQHISPSLFWKCESPIVKAAIMRSEVFVAHPVGDEDTILGWLACEHRSLTRVLHWVYVRSTWRGIGIARAMLQRAAIEFGATEFPLWSFDCNSITKKFHATYNPYLWR